MFVNLNEAIHIVNSVMNNAVTARNCGKSEQRLLHDEALITVLDAAERYNKKCDENKVLKSEVRLLSNDKEHLLSLVNEEKEKSEKAKQKLVACCKNSAEKIKNQREQLKACNKKIKEQQAEIERLERHELKEAMIFNSETVKKAVTEAVKEFAERLKENTVTVKIGKQTCRVITVDGIDYLLKETG